MDAPCRAAAAAEKSNTGRHRDDSETGDSEPPSMVGRIPIPPAKHGARRMRRSRSLPPPTTNDRGHADADADAGAPGRTTTGGKRFLLCFELPTSTEHLLFLLLLFVLSAPCCPWCATADQPMAMISRISWVSLLFCTYLFFLIAALSPTMSPARIFLRVSYLAVTGGVAAYAVSPFAGMVVLYLNTFHAAGFLGYALAEHHQLKSPAIRFMKNLKKSNPEATPNKASATSAATPKPEPPFYMSLLSVACGARVLWVCCALAPRIAVFETTMAVGICLFSWTCYLHYWTMNQLFLDVEELCKLACSALISLGLCSAIGGDLFGEFGLMFGVWFTMAAIAWFLGYTLAMCHGYKQLLQRPK